MARGKDELDRALTWARYLCGVGDDVMLRVDCWFFRWLYDRCHRLWFHELGGAVVLLAAVHYLPRPSAPDDDDVGVPCGALRGLIDGP